MHSRSVVLAVIMSLAAGLTQPIAIHIAGDSTAAVKLPEKRPETGWGEMLQQFFDSTAVRVQDHARNGRSTRTFISEGLWQGLVEDLRPGDYVFIQFGHNDESKEKTDRYTSPEDYRRNLVRMLSDVRAKGALPVLLTPVARRKFDDKGMLVDTHGEYPDIVRAVARENGVPLIDMHRKTGQLLQLFGLRASRDLFLQLAPGENANYPGGIQDNTHYSPFGARVTASLVVEGIAEAGLGLTRYFRQLPPPLKNPADTAKVSPPVSTDGQGGGLSMVGTGARTGRVTDSSRI